MTDNGYFYREPDARSSNLLSPASSGISSVGRALVRKKTDIGLISENTFQEDACAITTRLVTRPRTAGDAIARSRLTTGIMIPESRKKKISEVR